MDTPKRGRRAFLGLLASGSAATAGCSGLASFGSVEMSAEAGTTVGPDADGLTDEERSRVVDRATDAYGSTAASRIVPEGGVPAPGGQPGLGGDALVWDDTAVLELTDSSNATVAESHNYAALYATDVESEDGEYYVYWLWSAARTLASDDGTTELRRLWSHVDLANGGDLTVYEANAEGTDAGTVEPHPEKTGQDTDEFAVRWTGRHDGAVVMTGACTERRRGGERGFHWTVHLGGVQR